MPMFDTKSCKEISERPILLTPISLKCFYFFIKLKFNKNLELLENRECIRFLFDGKHQCIYGEVVNEVDVVPCPI